MAIISGTTVNWTVSPRIIQIPDPITEITITDLQDTLQALEDDEEGIIWPYLREMSGGEDLGGGTSVGFTMELQNAQVQFEGRTTATESGAVSSNDTTGTLLNATGGLFVTNGVSRGDTVFNNTTGSMGTILSVTDEQNLVSQQITGGARTTWLNTDTYSIYVNVQCSITGGNLVAVDDVDAALSPVLQSPNTNVIRTSSSSATLQNQEQLEATLFAGASGLGITIDPLNGTDSVVFPVGTRSSPCKTEANIQTLEAEKNFRNVYVVNNLTVTNDHSGDKNRWFADDQSININLDAGCDVTGSKFSECYLTGKLDSSNIIERCIVGSITNANQYIYESALLGPIVISDDITIENCFIASTAVDQECVIDFNSLAKTVIIGDWSAGRIVVKNMTTGSFLGMSGTGGRLVIDSTSTGGTAVYGGSILIENNGTVDTLQNSSVAGAVWDQEIEAEGNITAEQAMSIGLAALAGEVSISGNTITFKTPNGNVTRIVSTATSTGERTNIALSP